MEAGEYEKAIRLFQKVAELKPDKEEAWHNLGNCYDNLKQPRKAREYYEKAIAIGANPAESHFSLGLLLAGQDDSSGATRQFRAAAEDFHVLSSRDPNNHELYNRESGAWFMLEDYRKSINLLEKAVSLKPDYADAWVGLGMNHAKQGKTGQAIRELEKAKELHRRQGNSAGVEEAEENLRSLR